jgi:uncharacterized protein (DUF1499 family)
LFAILSFSVFGHKAGTRCLHRMMGGGPRAPHRPAACRGTVASVSACVVVILSLSLVFENPSPALWMSSPPFEAAVSAASRTTGRGLKPSFGSLCATRTPPASSSVIRKTSAEVPSILTASRHHVHSPALYYSSAFVGGFLAALAALAALAHQRSRPAPTLASAAAFALSVAATGPLTACPAEAFPNALPEAAQFRDRFPGKPPVEIGVQKRNELDGDLGLKACGKAQRCFSTTPRVPEQDTQFIRPWSPPPGTSPEEAIAAVRAVVERYPPGQSGIDGGGFKIVTSQPDYLYAQFESLEEGNLDDVEFAAEGSDIEVRSESRAVLVDRGVNALRLNWIAGELRKEGWNAPAITQYTHPLYFVTNYEFLLMREEIEAAKTKRFVFDGLRMRAMTPAEEAAEAKALREAS